VSAGQTAAESSAEQGADMPQRQTEGAAAEELMRRAAFPGTDDSEGSGYDAFDKEIKLYRDAVFAEKGDNLVPSLEELCSQVGMTADECLESQAENRVFVLYDLETYMEEHPEVKGIEYDGEIRTAEELDAIWDAKLEELYGDESTD